MTIAEDPPPSDYQEALKDLHQRLRLLQITIYRQKRRAIIVLEGYDAAGKGGCDS